MKPLEIHLVDIFSDHRKVEFSIKLDNEEVGHLGMSHTQAVWFISYFKTLSRVLKGLGLDVIRFTIGKSTAERLKGIKIPKMLND